MVTLSPIPHSNINWICVLSSLYSRGSARFSPHMRVNTAAVSVILVILMFVVCSDWKRMLNQVHATEESRGRGQV